MKDYTKNRSPEMLEPFFPNELFRHLIVSCFLVVVELIAVMFFPAPVVFAAKPDHIPWFLYPIYLVKTHIHNEIFFIILLVTSAFVFIFLPFIIGGISRSVSKK
ncbi:MAG: hypothetical protein MRJ65_06430 [Candidatus Brocadiaceae bacterium]|nr:hypothetical protein [Candidatus Brocadiaceae bacterium]